jgi:hypothetical protein
MARVDLQNVALGVLIAAGAALCLGVALVRIFTAW